MPAVHNSSSAPRPRLARRLGRFDATMMVMGGIIGAGIFINPYVVAQSVHTPLLVVGAWIIGGIVALLGATIYAELSARIPDVGGQYAFLRTAYHPAVAFLYGWVLLLVIQTGGMAAVAIIFARYFIRLMGLQTQDWVIAVLTLSILTAVNCLGVRPGASAQNLFMLAKITAIGIVIACPIFFVPHSKFALHPVTDRGWSADLVTAFGTALIPVLFSYGGWHTAGFVNGELRNPERDMPPGILMGVAGVMVLYTGVAYVCVRALGVNVLSSTTTPASSAMEAAVGHSGAVLASIAICISALGFLSQCILTAPRVYFAMARDGLFFPSISTIHPRARVPMAAIVLQTVWAVVIAVSGRYEQILGYVVSMDFIFYGVTALSLFVVRSRARRQTVSNGPQRTYHFKVPGHPITTAAFVIVCWLVAINAIYRYPQNTLIGIAILLLGIPVYVFSHQRWRTAK